MLSFKSALMACVVSSAAFAADPGMKATTPGTTTTGSTTTTTGSTAPTAGTPAPGMTTLSKEAQALRTQMVPNDEKAFLLKLNHMNEQEVKASKLAQQKATHPQVKQFAEMMVTDHTQANEKLAPVLKERKITIAEPKPANDVQKRMRAAEDATMQKLQALSGDVFDRAYMTHMLGSHDMALTKLQTAQMQFNNAQLRPMMTEMMTRVASHRDQAYQILGQLKIDPSQGVGGSGTTPNDPNMQGGMQHHR